MECKKCDGTGFVFDANDCAVRCDCKTGKPIDEPKEDRETEANAIIGRDEMNLCSVALCDFGSGRKIKKTQLIRSWSLKSGYSMDIEAMGDAKLGLPTSSDMDLLVVLLQISKEQDFPRKNEFDGIDLLRRLGRPKAGKSYQATRNGLRRLKGLTFNKWSGWYSKQGKSKIITGQWSLLDSWNWATQEEIEKGADSKSWFIWGSHAQDSMQQGYIKQLDLNKYFSLPNPEARFIFRYVDRHLYKKDTYTVSTRHLYEDVLGLSWGNKKPKRMIDHLKKLLGPLEEVGVSTNISVEIIQFKRCVWVR